MRSMKKAMIVVLVGIMLAFVGSVSCIALGTDKDIAEVTVRYHYEGMEDKKVKLKDFDFGKPATGENEVVKFTGWYYNGKPITKFPRKIKNDFTLDANWEYETTLKDEIFDDVKTDTYQIINNNLLSRPNRDLIYEFLGWYIDGNKVTKIDKVYLSKVILAKWNNINVIKSVADLKNASLKKNYVLKTDLDLSGLKTPLFAFQGDLNGLGQKLSGFKYDLEEKSYEKEKTLVFFP